VRTPHGTNGTARPSVDSSTKFLNPVCGKEVDIIHPKHTEEHEGTSYYFCCDGCWNTFRGDPAKYASIHQDTQRST
jgi:Cu+-exporting ATPase